MGCGDVRLLKTIGSVDFTGQERAAVNKLTMPFIAFDPVSKLIAAHIVGKRDAETTTTFIEQIRRRVPRRIQFYTDGFAQYPPAVEGVYCHLIDVARVIKPVAAEPDGEPGHLDIREFCGRPGPDRIGTSYVERNNLTIRRQLRRFTRQTLGFSKSLEHLRAAVTIYVAWYNLCRRHGTLRMTPAMELGIAGSYWQIERLLP